MLVDNLKRLREQAGLSQSGLAKKAKLSIRNIQNWEQGQREPDLQRLRLLAGILGVTLDELTADPPEEKVSKRQKV
jgi:transcriptional regulator with XRE-family HTH domain